MTLKIKESQIQKQIVDYLSLNARKYGFGFFSVPNEGFMVAAMQGMEKNRRHAMLNHFKSLGMVPGIPDLCILYRGQVYFIEVKTKQGKLSRRQQIINNWLYELDVPSEIVTSVEEVEDFLKEFGIIK